MVAFRLTSAAVRGSEPGSANHLHWDTVAATGGSPPHCPDEGSLALPLIGAEVLVLPDPELTAEERNILID
jgi:hypothetical protein